MPELKVVDDPPFQECAACGYTWISHEATCPACNHFGPPGLNPLLINWADFWARDPATEDWLVWPLVPAGRGVALYAPAKAGKSLVTLALVAQAATGQPGLDGVKRDPVEVLYLDYEMTLDDLQERLEALGYGPDSNLSHLHYASLPSLPPMNGKDGAKALLDLIRETGAQLVVIDTFVRALEGGEESRPETYIDFYYWTGRALKAAGVAYLRTDHAGKDLERGQRGSSAKNDDVDIVWQLTRVQTGVVLRATHRRIGWCPEQVQIHVDDSSGWELKLAEEESYPTGTKELAELLDRLGVDMDASYRTANVAVKAADPEGKGRQKSLLLAAQRWRRASLPTFINTSDRPGTGSGTAVFTPSGNGLSEPTNTDHELPGMEPVPEPPGTAVTVEVPPGFPIRKGTGVRPGADDDIETPF